MIYSPTRVTAPKNQDDWVRRSVRLARQIGLVIETGPARRVSTACQLREKPILVESLSKRLNKQDYDSARRAIRRELERRSQYHDTQYAFVQDVRESGDERSTKRGPPR